MTIAARTFGRRQNALQNIPKFIPRLMIILALLLLAVGSAFAQDPQPLPLNPDVTPDTIKATICVHGWTKIVRPPVGYTDSIKRQQMQTIGLPWSRASEFELDHRIPLTLGGAPRDRANLWLQSWKQAAPEQYNGETAARVKDKLEVRLNRLVCSGQITLDEAQHCIYEDWRACAMKFPTAH
jgi:hypothetical protein